MSEHTRVSISASGDELLLTNSYGAVLPLSPEETAAIREFFQAERDAELGRWRDPEAPHMVVYPVAPGVNVLDENKGDVSYGWCRNSYTVRPASGNSFATVAHRYFEAHPLRAPEPWEAAEHGDVWALTTGEDDPQPFKWSSSTGQFTHVLHGFALPLSKITDGKRIWPEVTPDE